MLSKCSKYQYLNRLVCHYAILFPDKMTTFYDTYKKYKSDSDTQQEAKRISITYSTFTQQEIEALLERVEGCRDRFVEQGGGKERAQCICSVLNQAKIGNGGKLPEIDDWQHMYDTLKCEILY